MIYKRAQNEIDDMVKKQADTLFSSLGLDTPENHIPKKIVAFGQFV